VTPDDRGEVSVGRPVILGNVGVPRDISVTGRGGGRVVFGSIEERIRRLDARFAELETAFGSQVQLAESIQAADPQLVLVFEARDEQVDLASVARNLNLEVLVESESRVEPDDEFSLGSATPRNPLVSSCLHAVCLNQTALENLLGLWRAWQRDQSGTLGRGYAPLRELFGHLKDVRPWGPEDRLKLIDWDTYFAGQLVGNLHSIDVELWFRRSPQARAVAEAEVVALIEQAGGSVSSSAIIERIGYHGLKATVPISVLEDLARRRFDAVQLVKSANVMYLRASGQSSIDVGPNTDEDALVDAEVPAGDPPVVCLFDGVPATNHPLLADRVLVYDPDDLVSGYTVDDRKHGTWMSSAVVWGDRSYSEPPARRTVLVRPILCPSDETVERVEELPAAELVPDLMWRAFRELFESGPDGTRPAAPDITIINLSVGDPATPFDTLLSSWARAIDWLSYEYGVLVIVSAGNYSGLTLTPVTSSDLLALEGDARRQAVLEALERQQNQRRLLAPAESINAITVGALHADGSVGYTLGYRVDPSDGLISISPVSAIGSGYRRSVKPDLAAPGGKALFMQPVTASDFIQFGGSTPLGPGIKVASTPGARETFTVGTSAATALVTRQAARLYDLVEEITAGMEISRRQRAVAIKALLVHGTREFSEIAGTCFPLERAVGNGILLRDLAAGCAVNEAVLLFLGEIRAAQEQDLVIPLPNGLSIREAKRIDATLAWLSPVNWRHRQYRRAALSFITPSGDIPPLGRPTGLSIDMAKSGATTVQHASWETQRAFAGGQGSSITIRVKCLEQAGGLDGETINYAAVASIWVAPTVGVDVYAQVRDQIRARIPVQTSTP
jgi:Subtilase family